MKFQIPKGRFAVFINDTSQRNNWGCRATSLMARQLIEESLKGLPVEHLVCLEHLNPTSPGKQLGRSVRERIRGMIGREGPLSPVESEFLLSLAYAYYGIYIDVLVNSSVIFYQAEGALNGESFAEAEGLLLLPFISKRIFEKPVIAFNQTLYSADQQFADVLGKVFSELDYCAVRETASAEFLKARNLKSVQMIPDAAFLCGSDLLNEYAGNNSKTFAVTGCAKSNRLSLDNYLRSVARIQSETGLTPRFYLSTSADKQMWSAWKALCPESGATLMELSSAASVALQLSGECFLMGGRYHMAILSATVGTPFILFDTDTHKNDGLISLLLWRRPVFCYETRENLIVEEANYVVTNRAALSKRLRERVSCLRMSYSEFTRNISELLRKKDLIAAAATNDIPLRKSRFFLSTGIREIVWYWKMTQPKRMSKIAKKVHVYPL